MVYPFLEILSPTLGEVAVGSLPSLFMLEGFDEPLLNISRATGETGALIPSPSLPSSSLLDTTMLVRIGETV